MGIVYAFLILAATVVVLMFFVAVGHILREPKHKAAWAQLSGIIGGIYSSKIGAMYYRYQISGSYQGIPVDVFIETRSRGEDEPNFYTYHLRLKAAARGRDWILRFGDAELPGLGRNWYFESRDNTLEQYLTEALGSELLIKDAGAQRVEYKADKGTLEYEKSVEGDTSVPAPDEFKAQFNLLRHLSELSEKVNVS